MEVLRDQRVGFLENFNSKRFVAENAFQLAGLLFKGLYVGYADF